MKVLGTNLVGAEPPNRAKFPVNSLFISEGGGDGFA